MESGNFAPPSSIQRSDSRNNSKLLLQKDKLIESLRLELAEAQIKLVESENQGGGRLHEVERLLMEARMANARLMEDNESYQLLLQEKTLHGDFGKGDFSYMGVSANQDALNALEGRPSRPNSTRPNSGINTPGTSLADELGSVGDENENESEEQVRRLETELRAVKDQNKALTLYINKIIERLLQHQEFEHILDQSSDAKQSGDVHKELPAPPAEAQNTGASLLQRAKSIAIGPSRPKPRPMSMAQPLTEPQQPSAHSNPDTAPRIPIALGKQAARRSRPMSEQFVGAAGVVNAMYKGPDGPLSPTLSNPRHSQSIFSSPRMASSAATTPTTSGPAGNFPGSMRSETSSVSGDSAADGDGTNRSVGTPSTAASMTQSPPRGSHSSTHSGETSTTIAGNKPRPLRLVQETAEAAAAAAKQESMNKRQSWMGWSPWAKRDEHPGATA